MNSSKLRKIRVVVSIFFLIITAIAFLDINHAIPTEIINYFLYFQFVPSVLKFFNVYTLLATGFIIVTILVLLYGRIYCSSVCPIGTLQDISSNISKKFNKRKKYHYTKEYKWLRYTVLLLTLVFILAGNMLLLNLLDPYSNAGRIFAQLINPLVIAGNNFLSFTLEKLDVYLIYPIDPKSYSYLLTLFPFIFLVIIVYLSYKRGRLYCNTICPVGTLLGYLSKFSFYQLKIDKTECEGCGVCEIVCKSECIDFKTKEIDFTRCVACFNCMDVCPSEVISYQHNWKTNEFDVNEKDNSKREFISKTFIYFIGLSGISLSQVKIIPEKESTVPVNKKLNVITSGIQKLRSL